MDAYYVLFEELGAIILDCIKRKDTSHEIFHGTVIIGSKLLMMTKDVTIGIRVFMDFGLFSE